MKKVSYLILGAGPAGLTAANMLLDKGITDFLVIEKEEVGGGLCRTNYVHGNPVDIGGGHILDAKNKRVDEFFFRFLPKDKWNTFTRDSQIYFKGKLLGSPFESHIWQLPIADQVDYLKSIAIAGCNLGITMPERFVDWIYWKLGERIAEDYMLPYNRKMFSENLNQLGTYWLEKLPNVSFEETLMSCLEKKFYGKQPCHNNFYYPKGEGFGDNFVRMQNRIGDRMVSNTLINSIDFDKHLVNNQFVGEHIIVAMPWTEFEYIKGMPEELISTIKSLKYSSVQIDYYDEKLFFETTAQWVYFPDEEYSFHRIMVMENFALRSKGYWTETNSKRVDLNSKKSTYNYLNKYAYPLNTLGKNEKMDEVLDWSKKRKVYGIGRWGEWQHYNCDVVMERSMNLIDNLTE